MNQSDYSELLRLLQTLTQLIDKERVSLLECNVDCLHETILQKTDVLSTLQSNSWKNLTVEERESMKNLAAEIARNQTTNTNLTRDTVSELQTKLEDIRKSQVKLKEFSKSYAEHTSTTTLSLKA
ncbi:MAG: hypothetical protein A2007_00150 [Verrucomicrobia bacterium GWC2_42_7]|nr:MAG: hypothetical protein A2007_00150 [Verrucomicrobia bacterium GWC2_42_7]